MRGKLAIGITANFVNGRTVEETQVPEISGVARIYNQSFFQSLLKATGQGPSLSQGFSFPCLTRGCLLPLPPAQTCPQAKFLAAKNLCPPGIQPSQTHFAILHAGSWKSLTKCVGFCFVLLYICIL